MEIKVKIPENLNIVELLQAANREPKSYLVDKVAFICHEVHLAAVYHRDYLENEDRPFFPLYSKILQKYIHDYKEIELLLIDGGVIECNGKYSKINHQSFRFRFTEKYYGQKFKEHEIITIGLHNKIQVYYKTDPLPPTPENESYQFLKEYWTNHKLKIDVERAMKWIDAAYQSEMNFLNSQYAKKGGQKKVAAIKKLTEKCEIWKTSVQNYNTGRLVFRPDDFSKRLHTKLTNLKKELRGFITYDGMELVSLDIKNSQPYLSLVLFNEDFWRERAKNGQNILLYRKIGLDKIKKEIKDKLCNSNMLAKTSKSEAGKWFEFDNYMSLVTSGRLYEYLIKLFCEIRTNPFLRDEVKKKFLIYLYYDPANLDKFEEGYASINLLNEVFPNISALFLLLKAKGTYKVEPPDYKAIYQPVYQFPFHALSAKDSFKFPPQLLQRIESHLVIEVVCKGLKKGNRDIPLFTIHDSIVTTKEFQQIVHGKMIEVLKNAIGFEPTIEPQYFTPVDVIAKTDFT